MIDHEEGDLKELLNVDYKRLISQIAILIILISKGIVMVFSVGALYTTKILHISFSPRIFKGFRHEQIVIFS